MNQLIIISGHSCTGKTTIGQYLADKFNYPFFRKDAFKETLFNSLGWSSLEQSRKLGGASMALLFLVLEQSLKREQSVIIEANFKPELDTDKIKSLLQLYPAEVIELHCFANPEVLMERFTKRFESGERHPGHLDDQHFETARENFAKADMHGALNAGKVFKLDTSDFKKVDYEAVLNIIKRSSNA